MAEVINEPPSLFYIPKKRTMAKVFKTYGVSGLMEWHALLSVGKCKMRVVFTGGALSGYGVTPATFTTSDTLTQQVIEHCADFLNGKIQLLKEISDESEAEEVVAEEASTLKSVDVASVDDAKIYLQDNYGVDPVKLKTKKSVELAAKTNGIVFNYGV